MAPRLGDMILTYFVCGAVMWATGFLEWEETGLGDFFISIIGGDVSGASRIQANLTSMGGPIGNVVNTLGGGLLAVWNFIVNIISFWAWPVTALQTINAPTEAVVLIGGPMSVAFTAAFITMIRGSA